MQINSIGIKNSCIQGVSKTTGQILKESVYVKTNKNNHVKICPETSDI